MRQKLYTILIALVVSAITTQAMAQVNMSRSITLTVPQGKEIKLNFAANAANTPVRIVSGSTDQTLTVGTNWYGTKPYLAQASTMTIYGNVAKFNCEKNQLTSLDVSNNTALTKLQCYYNQLTALDVSKNTALTFLDCSDNELTTLDVSKNTALTELQCYHNQLTTLDVSNNTALTFLDCSYNQLTTLDVSKNTELTTLIFYVNQLTSLDVSKNTALTYLDCSYNQLTTLDVSKNTKLIKFICSYNRLRYLNVANGNNANFDSGTDSYSPFNATGNRDLKVIYIDKGFTPPTSPVSKEWRKDPAAVWDDKFTPPAGTPVIDMTTTGNKSTLVIASSLKTDVPVWVETGPGAYQTMLTKLIYTSEGESYSASFTCNVSGNALRVYGDVSVLNMPAVSATSNKVKTLDIKDSPNLEELRLSNHALTQVDIGKNPKIRMVDLSNNQLTQLNLANGTNAYFDSKKGNRPAVDVTGNAGLSNITVDPDFFPDNLSGSKEWRKDAAANWIAGTVIPVPPAGTPVMEITTSTNASILLEMLTKEPYTPVWVEAAQGVYQFHYGANNEIAKTYTVSGNKLRVYGDVSHLAIGGVGAEVTALDVSKNKALETLYCSNTHVSSIDVSKNPNLTTIDVRNNKLTYLNLMNGNNGAMKEVKATGNPNLRDIYVDAFFDPDEVPGRVWQKDATARWVDGDVTPPVGTPMIEVTLTSDDEDYFYFHVWKKNNSRQYIWIEAPVGTIRDRIYIEEYETEWQDKVIGRTVRIHGYFDGVSVNGNDKSVKKVDASNYPDLTSLTIYDTDITSLDLSNNLELQSLYCYSNPKLTSLDVRGLKKLSALDCSNNALTSLNVANGNNANFESFRFQRPAFDATGNPGLKTINVDEGFDPTGLTGKKEWRKDAAASWSSLTGLPSLSAQGIKIWGGKGVIHITSAELDEAKTVHVYNVSGALVRTLPFGYGEMLVTNIPAGKYIVKIGDAAEKVVVR